MKHCLLIFLALTLNANGDVGPYESRTLYKAALEDLKQGRTSAFNKKQQALADYALAPYLEYRFALRHISSQKQSDIESFETRWPSVPARKHLRRTYLSNLARRQASKQFLAAYPEDDSYLNADLRCFRARALYATGQKQQAFALARELWMVGKSQSKECDPIFKIWRGSNEFTQEDVWRRLQLAVEANQRTLARYLISFLKNPWQERGERLFAVHANPKLVERTNNHKDDTSEGRYIVLHGLTRLAARQPKEAEQAWSRYQQLLSFTEAEATSLDRRILPAVAGEGEFPPASFSTEDSELISALTDIAVQEADFSQVERLVEMLPENERLRPEWQYWLARALEHNHGDNERAELTYRSLAGARHYYGFLAADRANVTPGLQDRSQPIDDSVLASLTAIPSVARAIELFAVGDRTNAHREWNQALDAASTQQERRLLGYAALHLGELRLAISTANRSDLTDEVSLRFPMGYMQQFRTASAETALPIPLLMAVTRQESAFDRTARSHANARGLMQLMPATARTVAKRLRESAPSTTLLYQADTNVRLGAHYLAWLSERFNGQLPLVVAAYNAGEHRVDRWIRDQQGLDMDVWIERIPYRETRNYVKNVLAFKQVYTQLLDAPLSPTLRPHEQAVVGR